MDILYLLVPLSVVLVLVIGAVLWMAVDGGQFDDLDGPALRVVVDDDRPEVGNTPTRALSEGTGDPPPPRAPLI
jgi:cbb3-type cytochrome oxidase maturation protein